MAGGHFQVIQGSRVRRESRRRCRLVLDPPGGAVVLSIDEKTQVQALDRTQPTLPLDFGKRRSKRTTTCGTAPPIFAALNVHTGEVFGECKQTRNGQDFLDFLKRAVKPHAGKSIHVVLDNLSTHATPDVQEWLDKNQYITFHFTPVGSSWLNQVVPGFARRGDRVCRQERGAGADSRSRPDVAEEIEHLVFRAMHKEPGIRFANGRELSRALRQVRGHSIPVDFRTEQVAVEKPRPLPAALDRKTSRRKVLVAVAAAVLAIGVAAVWLSWPVERLSIAAHRSEIRPAIQTSTVPTRPYADPHVVSRRPAGPAGDAVRQVLEVLRRFLQQKADVSSRDAIHAITAATGAELVVVPRCCETGRVAGSRRAARSTHIEQRVGARHDPGGLVADPRRGVSIGEVAR